MRIALNEPEWQRVIKALKIKIPMIVDDMAFNVIANTAAEARQSEQSVANDLQLGKFQRTARRRKSGSIDVIERVNLKRTKAGWVSTTRTSSKTGDFQMSHFSWERARTKYVKTADYTNQLANLWHRRSKPYTKAYAPKDVEDPGNWPRWGVGAVRPVRYSWSKVEGIIKSSVSPAVRRTELQFDKLLKKETER